MSIRYVLSISPRYVSHWGTWEAARELIQNAIDQYRKTGCYVGVVHDPEARRACISTGDGKLSRQSLILGETTKCGDDSQIGQFGEGYKLAMLVLLNSGYTVEIRNGDEWWHPSIEMVEEYGCDLLCVRVAPLEEAPQHVREWNVEGVSFIIDGIPAEDWAEVAARHRLELGREDEILTAEGDRAKIFCGGLFVNEVEGLRFGYSFTPSTLRLDRDRSMASHFDIKWETARLWERSADAETLAKLLEEEAPDVELINSHVSGSHSASAVAYRGYYWGKHGTDAIPVSTQEEIQRASAAGKKWVLVPKTVRSILRKVWTWFIPSAKTPLERLKELLAKVRDSLPEEARLELEDVIRCMEGSVSA